MGLGIDDYSDLHFHGLRLAGAMFRLSVAFLSIFRRSDYNTLVFFVQA